MHSCRSLSGITLGLLSLVAIGACGGDSSGPKTNTTINQTEAAAIGDVAASEVGAIAGGLADFSGGFGNLTGGFFAPATPAGRAFTTFSRLAPAAFRPALSRMPADTACHPTISGDTTDTDGDGIINNATFSFNAGNCSYDDGQGNSIVIKGSITLQDTDNATVLFGYAVTFTNFGADLTFTSQQGTHTASFTVSGNQAGSVTANNASSTETITYRSALDGTTEATVGTGFTVTFTPTSGTIDPASQSRLQDGSFTMSGSFSFSGNSSSGADGSWAFSLGTTTDLAYDSTCFAESPFTGGQIQGSITANTSAGFTVDYGPACGQVAVTAYTGGV